jgi:FMN phosphatase YigB (HAD superfamily)
MIKTVLFDCGSVIASDPWEAMWLTQEVGLTSRLNLDAEKVYDEGSEAFYKFSVRPSTDDEFWGEFEKRLGVTLKREHKIGAEEATIQLNPFIQEIFEAITNKQISIGLITNNTSTLFEIQKNKMGLLFNFIDPDLIFTSQDTGCLKRKTKPDLFEYAKGHLDPSSTLVVDDREDNLFYADAFGFQKFHYQTNSGMERGKFYQPPEFYALTDELMSKI